jgi:hypothetical protein
MSDRPDLKWGVERRLEFIEFRLFWEGGVNRADIIEKFDVSVPQASKDLTLYQERAPGNVEYDKSAKRYVTSDDFRPMYLDPDPDQYLSRLRSAGEGLITEDANWISGVPDIDIVLNPKRRIAPPILKAVLQAVREKRSIQVLYQSMNREQTEPQWRRISPHAFGFDGFRWHARAFCHDSQQYKDFLLPRILEVGVKGEADDTARSDRLWNERFDIIVGPHPGLTPSQQKVVELDFGMTDGTLTLSVRYAMLFYVLKRLGLLGAPQLQSPRTQHIVAINREELDAAIQQSQIRL